MATWWRSYIAQRARQYGLDPRAVLAVASQEGLGGGVGDQGTSYGPFQLHRGGALPAGRGRSWAESQQGIDYALSRIAGVARGQRGGQAISSIVSRFERPADPRSEIAGALRSYGGGSSGAPLALSTASPTGQATSGPDSTSLRANVLSALIAASQQTGQHRTPDYTPVFAGLAALRGAQSAPSAPVKAGGALSVDSPAPKGGKSLSFLEPFAKRYGLSVTSTTGGSHVQGSYHYQGRAVDFGGDPSRMAALQHYAIAHPGEFVEVFYTGPGAEPYFVKNGHVYPIAGLNSSLRRSHTNHVHLAR